MGHFLNVVPGPFSSVSYKYERCKAEYEREKAQLDHLYEQQTLLWKEARQYMKNRCDDIYLLSLHFMGILTKYVPDEENQPNEADRQSRTDSQPETETATASATATTAGLPEYFSMKLISLIHEICVGEQFEDITAPDFYACMNLHPWVRTENKAKGKDTGMLSDFPDEGAVARAG